MLASKIRAEGVASDESLRDSPDANKNKPPDLREAYFLCYYRRMEDFKTLEGAEAIFKKHKALDKENNIFVLYLDTQHEGMKYGIAGGMAGGLAAGLGVGVGVYKETAASKKILEGDYKGLLVNATEKGLHLIALQGKGGAMLRIQPEKLVAEPDQYAFLDYGLIKGIEVKNFSFIQKKIQKVRISYGDKAKMFLLGNVSEKNIPYQAENFAKFIAKYKK